MFPFDDVIMIWKVAANTPFCTSHSQEHEPQRLYTWDMKILVPEAGIYDMDK